MFHISWSLPNGQRDSFTSVSAEDAVKETYVRRLSDEPGCKTPGLKITDAEKTKLSIHDLMMLAGQQDGT